MMKDNHYSDVLFVRVSERERKREREKEREREREREIGQKIF